MPAKSVHIGLVMPIFFRKVHTRENRNQKKMSCSTARTLWMAL